MHVLFELFAKRVFGGLEVVLCLHAHPERSARSEITGKAQCSVGGDTPTAANDVADACSWYAKVCGKTIGREINRAHPIFKEHFAGMDRR